MKYIDKKNKFVEMFDPNTGLYVRSGVIDEDGNDTGVDPFMRSFPSLIDVGIMGSCEHGRSGLCLKSGIQCYQNGLKQFVPNMTLEDYKKIIDEGKKKGLQQVALGGRGDPDMHENFEEILKYTRENGIVPNFTTSGLGMTVEKAELCKKYCGAVAVSMYTRLVKNPSKIACRLRDDSEEKTAYASVDDVPIRFTFGYTLNTDFDGYEVHDVSWFNDLNNGKYELIRLYDEVNSEFTEIPNYTMRAFKMLREAGVKTNIHFVLGNNTIDEAITRLKYNGFPDGTNAVIFLLHKPVGLGKEDNVLSFNDPRVNEFFSLIDNKKHSFKIGFDSCTVPAIINKTKNISHDSIDSCEGARFSMYISSDMVAIPCSFDNQEMRWAYSLNGSNIESAWNSEQFEDFRNHFRNSCNGCDKHCECKGGCPIRREIVLCESDKKNLV